MNTIRILLPVALVASICSCATGSQVVFDQVQPQREIPTKDAAASPAGEIFVLPISKVMATRADGSNLKLNVTVLPSERQTRYAVKPVNGWRSRTQLQMTRLPNTDLVQEVGTSFTDLTSARIEQIGGVATTLVGGLGFLSGSSAVDCSKHVELSDFVLTVAGEIRTPQTIPGNPCWLYTLVYASNEPALGAIPLKEFEQNFSHPVAYFPVPSCRDVLINVTEARRNAGSESAVIAARVADPDYVRLMNLPLKGSIKMHPICGADVSDDGTVDRFAQFNSALATAMAQAKAIEEKRKAVSAP